MSIKTKFGDVTVPPNHTNCRVLRFSLHLGQGVDAIVLLASSTFSRLCTEGVLSPSSLVTIARQLKEFFEFCSEFHRKNLRADSLRIEDLDESFASQWGEHCYRLRSPATGKLHTPSTRRHTYSAPKRFFAYAQALGLIERAPMELSRRRFPFANKQTKSQQKPYSEAEFKRLVDALRSELSRIRKLGKEDGSYGLTLKALVIAIRTGFNPASLADLQRDCLTPHPLDAARSKLTAPKRRAHRLVSVSLSSGTGTMSVEGTHDVVTLLKEILERTSPLLKDAPPHISNRVWLYKGKGHETKITHLTTNNMRLNITAFKKRTSLLSDLGKPLSINFARIRKTFVNRIYEKSGGDLFVTAQVANHSVRVADTYYLEAPPDGDRAFALAGEVVLSILRSPEESLKRRPYVSTPVAGCKDPLFGERAPKDGVTYCERFMHCFTCKHMVVAEDDLNRLFSFYWFVTERLARSRHTALHAYMKSVLRIIDEDISTRLNPRAVELAKAKSRVKPHPFWLQAGQSVDLAAP